jgi:cobalt-zinc-cadmium efflux system membrane fusion protein
MKFNTNQMLSIAAVLAVGVVLALLILGSDAPQTEGEAHGNHDHDSTEAAHEEAPPKGLHGGKLFTQDGYGVEVTIYETGVEPQFRVYTYRDGKPLSPADSELSLTLERLGRAPQVFTFVPEGDYLKGDAVVEEPHSFKVTVNAKNKGKSYRFAYEQVEARVAMNDEQLAQNKVEILTAGPARIASTLQLIGEIRFNEDRMVHVVPRLGGVVQSVSANAGDHVSKGQLLAVISSQGLSDQRAELMAAQKRLTLARTTYEREKKLWEDKISAEQDYLQAGAALQEAEIAVQNAQQKLASLGSQKGGGDLTRYEIRSPMTGVIVEKHLVLGEAIKDDATVFVIADLSSVWAEMTVYAKDLNVVKFGQKATVKATAFESESTGAISYVGSLVGEQTRTAKARVVLPNPEGVWRPGLPVNVELVAGEVEVPVAVSKDAIQTVRDWNVVFGRYGDYFEARPVKLGRSDGRHVEIVEGLNTGERYAGKNSFLIKADIGKSGASHDH